MIYEKVEPGFSNEIDSGYKEVLYNQCNSTSIATDPSTLSWVGLNKKIECSEIDLDFDGHIVFDKWLYVSFERTVGFSRISSVSFQKECND